VCHAELLTLKAVNSFSVAYSPDGKRLATGMPAKGSRGTVRVWDAQTGQELLTLKSAGINVAFSPDSKRLASAWGGWDEQQPKSGPGEVKVWEVQTGEELLSLKGAGHGVAYSPDRKRTASESQ